MMAAAEILEQDFIALPQLLQLHAQARPEATAVLAEDQCLTYRALHSLVDRVAASFQRDGLLAGEAIAICADTSVAYLATFLGALRAGLVVSPLAPGSTPNQLRAMLDDSSARLLFLDAAVAAHLSTVAPSIRVTRVSLDGCDSGLPFSQWLMSNSQALRPHLVAAADPFNIIYSSGTTGTPKGIVQSHGMRWGTIRMIGAYEFDECSITLVSTPLYSNTTLVTVLPTIALGGTVVLMAKFDAAKFLQLAASKRATHAMLVPVQYQRIMSTHAFDGSGLASFRMKFSTSAPLSADLKADVLARWPGGLVEFYGMTEGGGVCVLEAHRHSDKLGTVGRPVGGHDIRLIGDDLQQVPPGQVGEVVGHSAAMMTGYHNHPEKTAEVEWFDPAGKRFIRTGDLGRFDSDGFLTLLDRKKDMIISGGFNVYPADIEAVLREHPMVLEAAVVGVPSRRWGETPVAFVVLKEGTQAKAEDLAAFVN
ncbi:MAG TPA: class I adenylate-forming enzyme family protein, partial [Steroidobacteraceae bacterium]|nr:class I adenylate-forming enzyme family protein [Steroidobacteraceae bacterium]